MPPSKSSAHPENLAGSLLLAHPAMRDPNFRRTVIFMATHSAEGAMGVVLNRPTRRTLGTVNGSFAYTPLAEVPVFIGGPVQPEQLMLVVWQMRPEGYRLFFGIDPEKATELVGGASAGQDLADGLGGGLGGHRPPRSQNAHQSMCTAGGTS